LIGGETLRALFQPLVSLSAGSIFGYEAQLRGPAGSRLESPGALFRQAAVEHAVEELEFAALRAARRCWEAQAPPGRRFVNFGTHSLLHLVGRGGIDRFLAAITAEDLPATNLVIELTGHERVRDVRSLRRIVDALRAHGVAIALDDFGDGRSSLRLWAELQPEFVKIDQFFVKDIGRHSYKVQTMKALLQIAPTLGGQLVAGGIESEQEATILRDLGLPYGQGYYFGRPEETPSHAIAPLALASLKKREIAVLASFATSIAQDISAEHLINEIAPITPEMNNAQVIERFQQNPSHHAYAVVQDGAPIGLVNRRVLMDRYAQPFHRELFGQRSCCVFMNEAPQLLERSATCEQMMQMLTSSDQRYLTDGFIIVDGGRYVGLGTGEQLVRLVTESRLEAARHANPLTFLPGNIPINEHIDRLLRGAGPFTACYCDLNHFKPFNDQYGYWRGDEMIRLLAGVLVTTTDNRRDFVGHVGGDDFLVLFQSPDWQQRCEKIIGVFNDRALQLYDPGAIERGGIEAEDRDGRPAFFPLTTLSIGAVCALPRAFQRPEEVAAAAAVAKRRAKRSHQGLWIDEGRR